MRPPSLVDKALFEEFEYCRVLGNALAITPPDSPKELPLLKMQEVNIGQIDYIGFHNTRRLEIAENKLKTVGFFIDDRKFQGPKWHPWDYIDWLSQYQQTLSLDISCFSDMPIISQWESVYWARVIACFWQARGVNVIPTISWGDKRSYEFSFSGLPENPIVAISVCGPGGDKKSFLSGFTEFTIRKPNATVLCYGTPYSEMYNLAEIVSLPHEGRVVSQRARIRDYANQPSLFNYSKETES